jgi:signal transduction histidine kinase
MTTTARPGLWGIETEAQQLASLITRTLPVTVASVALWDEPSLSLTVKAVDTVRPVNGSLPVGVRVPLSDATWHRLAFEQSEPVLLEPNGEGQLGFEQDAKLALIPHVQSMYLLPIRFAEETVGVLVLGEARAADRERLSTEKQERCRAILEEFVTATAHAWEARRLRRQVRAMSSLMQAVRGASTAASFDAVLASVTAEVADWLGMPVRSALFGTMGRDIRLLAWHDLPDEVLSDGGRQMFLAMARSGVRDFDPVSVAVAGSDPLDPMAAHDPAARRWTRLGVPLMRDEQLVGVACLYLEDEIRLADWELEALRRRGEILALGVEAVEAARTLHAEQEQLHRVAFELLTGYRWALLREVFAGMTRTLAGSVERRLRETMPGLVDQASAGGESPGNGRGDVVTAVIGEMTAAMAELWEPADSPESSTSATMSMDANDLVGRALRIAKASLEDLSRRRGVPVVVRFDPSGQPVPVQGSLLLVGALVHAIESAVEATSGGGEVRVRTRRENGHAVISVEDTGRQAAPEPESAPLARFSVKHSSVVLSLMQSIVHPYGGRATLSPRETSGNSLILYLPTTAAVASEN